MTVNYNNEKDTQVKRIEGQERLQTSVIISNSISSIRVFQPLNTCRKSHMMMLTDSRDRQQNIRFKIHETGLITVFNLIQMEQHCADHRWQRKPVLQISPGLIKYKCQFFTNSDAGMNKTMTSNCNRYEKRMTHFGYLCFFQIREIQSKSDFTQLSTYNNTAIVISFIKIKFLLIE